MERRQLGTLEVSVVGLGCNNFGMAIDAEQTRGVVDAAIESGINYFDTAESYGGGESESFLDRALIGRRDSVLIASKWGHTSNLPEGERNASPERIRSSLEASLRRLDTDYIDHYQLHRPDPLTPVAETLGTLAELKAEGKIREIGCTAFSAEQLDEVYSVAGSTGLAPYPSVQNHYSLLTRAPETDGVLDACRRHGIVFVPFFPLESGLLTGKYRQGEARPEGSRLARWGERSANFIDDAKLETVARLTAFAESTGHTMLDLAFSWLVTNDVIASVIAGATSPEQVRANVAAAGWRLSAAELAAVDEILR